MCIFNLLTNLKNICFYFFSFIHPLSSQPDITDKSSMPSNIGFFSKARLKDFGVKATISSLVLDLF